MSKNKVHIRKEIEDLIKTSFDVSGEAVQTCVDSYNKIMSKPYEYLAHLIRTMEIFVREQKNKEYFRITVNPNESSGEIKDLAWATYSGDWYSFDIYYDSNLNEIQKRVEIAHELGHLFFDVISDDAESKGKETLSNLFGVAAMLHKYQCKDDGPDYLSEENLVLQFRLMQNRTDGVLNTSGK